METAGLTDNKKVDQSGHLSDTRRAFDQVAGDYDGSLGNNLLIQRLRDQFISELQSRFSEDDHLLDIGCGTGLDAVLMANRGNMITAIDWSQKMIRKTRQRAWKKRVDEQVFCHNLGAHEMVQFPSNHFDGIYSNLGVVNCIMDMDEFARQSQRILKKEGCLVMSVIGRWCPWEILYYMAKGHWKRALIRLKREPVAVNLEGEKVWTRYYSPGELKKYFTPYFNLLQLRSMNLFVPPPYLVSWYKNHPGCFERLEKLDSTVGHWPVLRGMGDHFLMVLKMR